MSAPTVNVPMVLTRLVVTYFSRLNQAHADRPNSWIRTDRSAWHSVSVCGTIGLGPKTVAIFIIELPDELARRIEGIAAEQHKSVQQLALDRLLLLAKDWPGKSPAGSAAAVLRAILAPPRLSASDVEDLDSAIAAGQAPIQTRDLLTD